MIRLAHKFFLFGLLLIPLLFFWNRWLDRRGLRHIWFSSRDLLASAPASARITLVKSLWYWKLAALTCFILALAQPQLLLRQGALNRSQGIDIMLTLDVSGSMAAVDFKPRNRLEVAKEVISRFIRQRRSDRLGLVVFAAAAATKCPLTLDQQILENSLSATAIGELEDGTALGMALANSINRIRRSPARTKLIILLTDGVNNRGEIDPRDAARMAKDFAIKVYTIGVGTRGRAPYPVIDSFGQQQFVMVPVEIDETLLTEIARTTGGLYFRATDQKSLQNVFGEIDHWEKSTLTSRTFASPVELFPYLIAAGLFILLAVEISRRTLLRTFP